MEIIRSGVAHRIENGDTFVAFEYPSRDQDLNISRIELTGRYPKEGMMRNNRVKEIVYVESGSGSVTIDGKTHELRQGDVVLYEKGEQVCWEGVLTLIIACSPAWTPEQHEFLPG